MRKHDSGDAFPLDLCSGDQQRTCERDITVFEGDFFPRDRNSCGVRSNLATYMIQIHDVNSCATKGECLSCRETPHAGLVHR
jgi:hypothetical protein